MNDIRVITTISLEILRNDSDLFIFKKKKRRKKKKKKDTLLPKGGFYP